MFLICRTKSWTSIFRVEDLKCLALLGVACIGFGDWFTCNWYIKAVNFFQSQIHELYFFSGLSLLNISISCKVELWTYLSINFQACLKLDIWDTVHNLANKLVGVAITYTFTVHLRKFVRRLNIFVGMHERQKTNNHIDANMLCLLIISRGQK